MMSSKPAASARDVIEAIKAQAIPVVTETNGPIAKLLHIGGFKAAVNSPGSPGCTWNTPHTGAANTVLCADGAFVSDWQCVVGGHGQRVQCPRNLPVMCAFATCGGGKDYCCSVDCSERGQRPCEAANQQIAQIVPAARALLEHTSSKPTHLPATLEILFMVSNYMAFNATSFLESMGWADILQDSVVANASFWLEVVCIISGNFTNAQAKGSVAQIANLSAEHITVTDKGKGYRGRRLRSLENHEESMLEITLKIKDAGAAHNACDASALILALTEHSAFVKSLAVKGCVGAVLVSTEAKAGQIHNTTRLTSILRQRLGYDVSAAVLEDGRFRDVLFAAAAAAASNSDKASGIEACVLEVLVAVFAATASVAWCWVAWKLKPTLTEANSQSPWLFQERPLSFDASSNRSKQRLMVVRQSARFKR
eukprot:TRINITY_DN12536_c0_g1_i2.p1 TRINITY_DN12536_c0_g1~~TRINITY_DN12536_c0_g1_i2.p1  ORF type:complete len:425 (+),score=78.95 TRINITY_DN12536_c0_g1_i2:763-2037(+)